MTVDPSDPEVFENGEPEAPGPEAPEADAAEQRTDVRPEDDEPAEGTEPGLADEADVAEQSRVVPLDEDDYR
ncbi:hypothetical protein EES43_19705 [Streptomyces sp. ADI96-02]|uniref:hypothetical protein n=1 Tax=unclassified Streptomyces TaxID=2593676 RepID=UPI000F551E23|nr:hypothetical protein [Streptomyces sp. ADI96-02]RPK58748.1 hypothetical protein EES43_19705 [Streptomyces sp. ADI96-02]